MKSYQEIITDIKQLKQIDIQQLEINLQNKCLDMSPAAWMEYRQTEEYTKIKTEIKEAYKQNEFNYILVKFLKHNAKIAKVEEIKTAVVEIWNTYAGKQYGPKTKDKIYQEIKKRCNCSSYINYSYYGCPKSTMNMIPLFNGYSIGTDYNFKIVLITDNQYQEFLTDDNKINKIDVNALFLQYKPQYINDPAKRIKQLEEIKAQAIAKQKELKEITSKYNSLIVDGIDRISATKNIY